MFIILNGKITKLPNGCITINDLVKRKKWNQGSLIVEYNNQLAKKDAWPSIILKENDRLEILKFVGGG
ncbi:sulfur carrier protein ThiS [Desulfotomaculum copahuensis]|uniref:Thiamine biosynthesis protein ThiS n=1 Tax=Desulfotomaculum copahuensis TaxID=1838280 RepID=A0A1B7LEG5_9FIRM|nr:sulfur carrier protein ThiS [Desulfotomaculum copahuensis]OAT81679.1 thiamine biosynthesis protein ThiS [Desulfotomaculum copahuensis]